jgi:hypothetical protein
MIAPTSSATMTEAIGPATTINLLLAGDGMAFITTAPSHRQTKFGSRDLAAFGFGNNPALEHHHDPVAQIEQFVEIERYQQHALAAIPRFDQLTMHKFNCAHIETSGWLTRHQDIRIPLKLSRDDQFLLVSA